MHLQRWKGVKTGLCLQNKTIPRLALVTQGNSLFFVSKDMGTSLQSEGGVYAFFFMQSCI